LREDIGDEGVFDGDADEPTPFVIQPGVVGADKEISGEGDETFEPDRVVVSEGDENEQTDGPEGFKSSDKGFHTFVNSRLREG
jgi:hypothetical protein